MNSLVDIVDFCEFFISNSVKINILSDVSLGTGSERYVWRLWVMYSCNLTSYGYISSPKQWGSLISHYLWVRASSPQYSLTRDTIGLFDKVMCVKRDNIFKPFSFSVYFHFRIFCPKGPFYLLISLFLLCNHFICI